ncbi:MULTISPECIES: hypothetical protein [Bradyrhizobium]|uniref:hypothetical protein n=1 Tax=Bradyrhizobium TaxID=374 RepID=UPI000417E0FB|nr:MULTISPECIES: hypothetical protein [Bradyrhizobium]UFW51080.1 hypothetical protein BaraCB756_08645 [Bradyrhizobium arachidis]
MKRLCPHSEEELSARDIGANIKSRRLPQVLAASGTAKLKLVGDRLAIEKVAGLMTICAALMAAMIAAFES